VKLEFSKLIALIIIVTWLLALIGVYIAKVVFDIDAEFILPYANAVMLGDIISYSVKSGAENLVKINNQAKG